MSTTPDDESDDRAGGPAWRNTGPHRVESPYVDPPPDMRGTGLVITVLVAGLVTLAAVWLWGGRPTPAPAASPKPLERAFSLPSLPFDAGVVLGRTRVEVEVALGSPALREETCDTYEVGLPLTVCFSKDRAEALEIRMEGVTRQVPRLMRWLGFPPYGPYEHAGVRYRVATAKRGGELVRLEPHDAPLPVRSADLPLAPVERVAPASVNREQPGETALSLLQNFPHLPDGFERRCRSRRFDGVRELDCGGLRDAKVTLSLTSSGAMRSLTLIDLPRVGGANACRAWLLSAAPGLTRTFESASGASTGFRKNGVRYLARWHEGGHPTCEIVACAAGVDECGGGP